MKTNNFQIGDKVSWFYIAGKQTVIGHIKELKIEDGRQRAIITHKAVKQFNHFFDMNIGCFALTKLTN